MKPLLYIFGILVLGLVFMFPQSSEGQSACAQAIGAVTSSWNPMFSVAGMADLNSNCATTMFAGLEWDRQTANGMFQIALESVWIDLHY
jgi:hypothetical protein